MATVTKVGTSTFNTTSGNKNSGSFTSAAGAQLIVILAHSGSTSTAAPTDNHPDGLGTYSQINAAVKAASADRLSVWARNALTGSAAATTVTHAPGSTTGGGLCVLSVSGVSRLGAAAARQSAIQSNQAAGGTPTPALSSAALTGNPVIGAVFNATSPAGLTQRTGYTEQMDQGYSTPTTGLEVMSRDSGETASSIAWGGTSASAFCSIAVELDTSQALIGQAPWSSPSVFFQHAITTTGLSQDIFSPAVPTYSEIFIPTVGNTSGATAPLLTNAQSFHSPTVTLISALSAGLLSNVSTFPAASVSSTYAMTPGLLTNAQSFYAPTVVSAATVEPQLIASSTILYSATVSESGPSFVAAPLLENEQTFFAQTIEIQSPNGVRIVFSLRRTRPTQGRSTTRPHHLPRYFRTSRGP